MNTATSPASLHRRIQITSLATTLLLAASLAFAQDTQTLSGTVTNGTTGKPAAGDQVILINLTNGMDVAANTKADSAGKFSFKLGEVGPHSSAPFTRELPITRWRRRAQTPSTSTSMMSPQK